MTSRFRTLVTSRRLRFAAAAVLLAAFAAGGALIAVDVYLHSKYERSAGFNIWGYRGPIAGRKQPGEYRIAVLGGSSAYGYGVTWDQALPAVLERRLNAAGTSRRTFRVVNLGYNNEGAYSFAFTMKDYAYLQYDLVCLYEGYNDLLADPDRPNRSVFRHNSPVFRLTGYMPIFPMIFKEKAALMLTGEPGGLYRASSGIEFRPGLAARAAATVLHATGEAGEAVERGLNRIAAEQTRDVPNHRESECRQPWVSYCRSVAAAIDVGLSMDRQMLFVTQPWVRIPGTTAPHVEQQREAAAMVRRRFGGDRRVRALDLGDALDLTDPKISFDRMHLTADGNVRLAERLVQPILDLAAERTE